MYFLPQKYSSLRQSTHFDAFAPKSAAAFEFNVENPLFRGKFWGFGGKVPLNLGPMNFVPKRDSPLRQTTSFDVLRA
jgi:hypothetical protein